MTGGAHGGDIAKAVSPLSLAKASAVAVAGYALERRGERPYLWRGEGAEVERNWAGLNFRLV